jgi:hypothetical protein
VSTHAVTSFRDPGGFCCVAAEQVLRFVAPAFLGELEAFLASPAASRLVQSRQLVSSRRLSGSEADLALQSVAGPRHGHNHGSGPLAVFQHERIPFPSYPFEWAPEMLAEAGRLTLELARTVLPDQFGLKDATPYNILFRGPDPVFIDVLSFEKRNPGDSLWRPYAQFVRTFILPLLANRWWGLRLADLFTARRDGLEPQEVYQLCSALQRLRRPALGLVSLPTWLGSRARAEGADLFRPRLMEDHEKARFIVESLFGQLEGALRRAAGTAAGSAKSTWSDYMATHSYNDQAFAAKEEFVKTALAEFKPRRGLDVGAKTGHFSALASRAGAEVVAIDYDAACVGAIWQRARSERLNILPLVVDLSRPSPALGWRNRECPSFLERAAGKSDGVLMLAVIHHLLVTERVPLEEILLLASQLTTSLLIVEFVGPEDVMFRQLTRGRDELHAGLNPAGFEAACARHFEIVHCLPLAGTHRRMYALRRKAGGI